MSRLKLTDAQRKLIDYHKETYDYSADPDPEVRLLRECKSFAEKLLVVHGINGLRGVAGVLNYSPYDKKIMRETVTELRRADTDLSNVIADLVQHCIPHAPRHQPYRWQQLRNKRRTG
jgi:hypothetical protein